MKIVIAPDSFKGSLSAPEVASAIEQGFAHALPAAEYIQVPMADGGEGLLSCLLENGKISIETTEITNPVGEKIQASLGFLKDNTAVIEMAQASGITLIPPTRHNPLHTTTFGTGELIRYGLEKGSRRFIIGLGGSATCDGGIGALAALGIQFKDIKGTEISHTGAGLGKLSTIDSSTLDPRAKESEFILAHDVDNPLLGLEGTLMYAPQKGATAEHVEILHKNLENYALLIAKTTNNSMDNLTGTGAGGGLAAGFHAFLNATLQPGAPLVMDTLNLREVLKTADLVITGEGQIDSQSVHGKVPVAVARLAKEFNLPVIAIAARLGKGYYETYDHGIDAVFSMVNGPLSEQTCLAFTEPLLAAVSNNIARLLALRIPL